MHVRSLLSVVCASVVALSGAAEGAGPALVVHHFKEPRALELDESRIAILILDGAGRSTASVPEEVAEALQRVGVDGRSAERWPIAGWWLAPIDEGARAGRSAVEIAREAVGATDLIVSRSGARAAFVTPVFVDNFGGPLYPTPEILVQFAPGTSREAVEDVLAETGAGTVIEADWGGMAGSYRIDPGVRDGVDVLGGASALATHAKVVYAEPDMVFTGRGDAIPNDPGFINCWGLQNTAQFLGGKADADMNGPEAWDTTWGSSAIITVILDVGVQKDHPDIHQAPGFDTTVQVWEAHDGSPIGPWDNHGTAVAGCVSAIANNGIGTVGVAPATRIMSARTFVAIDEYGSWTAEFSNTVNSLTLGFTAGARVTNNSNSYGYGSSGIEFTYAATRGAGMVHFASAGNSGIPYVGYPAILPSVLAIGALDYKGHKAYFSSYGPDMDFFAPGEGVYSTDRTGADGYLDGDYGYMTGTSFSSPYAAGVAALILSRCSSMTAEQVEAKMIASCRDMRREGRDDWSGWGLIRADLAVAAATTPPCGFALVSPVASATDVLPTATLDWAPSAWADSYRVRVVDQYGAVWIDRVVTTGDSFTPSPGELRRGRVYTWSVSASNAQGITSATPVSRQFTTAPVICEADVSGDDQTTIKDFNVLAGAFGQPVPIGTGADLDFNGVVNVLDFSILATEFGCSGAP